MFDWTVRNYFRKTFNILYPWDILYLLREKEKIENSYYFSDCKVYVDSYGSESESEWIDKSGIGKYSSNPYESESKYFPNYNISKDIVSNVVDVGSLQNKWGL